MPWSRNTAWRQGSVLALKDFQNIGLLNDFSADLAIAISHDCDIANDNLEDEPYVEFIFAQTIEEYDGNLTYGRNPRTLHLNYICGEEPIWIKLKSSEKFVVKKDLLETIEPDNNYILNSIEHLQYWLAIRYKRIALPNSLANRLKFVNSYIERRVRTIPASILSFCLAYDPKHELSPDEPYEIKLSIVYTVDLPNNSSTAENIAQELRDRFPSLLERTREFGTVDLSQCDAVSEEEFTLSDLRETVELRLGHLSYRTDPSGPVV